MNRLEQLSNQRKQQAIALLIRTDLERRLSGLGEPRIGGSFALDLMWSPDLDVTVATPEPRASALSFLREISESQLFQRCEFGDFERFPRPNRPRGYIVTAIIPWEGSEWEIEVWFLLQQSRDQITFEERIRASLSPASRLEILNLKREREESYLSKHEISSVQIYEAVLSGEKETLTALRHKLTYCG